MTRGHTYGAVGKVLRAGASGAAERIYPAESLRMLGFLCRQAVNGCAAHRSALFGTVQLRSCYLLVIAF